MSRSSAVTGWRSVSTPVLLFALAACSQQTPRALGTLEWDRLSLPAPAAEKIVAVEVREGQHVKTGDMLLQLETAGTASQLAAAAAQEKQSGAALAELKAGPRKEEIAQAQAALAAAQAGSIDAAAQFARMQQLVKQQLVATADVDKARAAADSAAAQVRSAQQALLELQRGTRSEQIAQGVAAQQAARAQAAVEQVLLGKLTLTAPRDGVIDSIPYKLGDQAPVGAPLVVMLAGEAPYARVYVPEPIRNGVKVGSSAIVHLNEGERSWKGTVRMIRSDPSFTPYYALTGQDAARLSYLAEIQLGVDARDLPAGLPLWVEFTQ